MTATPAPSSKIRRLHRLSAIILGVFVFAHLFNHVSGLFGIETYNAVQKTMRIVYRFWLVEAILLIVIAVQMVLGGILLVRAILRGWPQGFWAWAQILSGGIFLLFMAEHMFALAMARLYFQLDTNFYWPASVMSGPPYTYYFIPYYFLGVFALMTHIGVGLRYWAMDANPSVFGLALGNTIGIGFMIAGAAIGALIIPILTGMLFPISMPPEWIEYLRFFLPSFSPTSG